MAHLKSENAEPKAGGLRPAVPGRYLERPGEHVVGAAEFTVFSLPLKYLSVNSSSDDNTAAGELFSPFTAALFEYV